MKKILMIALACMIVLVLPAQSNGKAQKEAKGFGEVVEVASSKDANYNYYPKNYEKCFTHCSSSWM